MRKKNSRQVSYIDILSRLCRKCGLIMSWCPLTSRKDYKMVLEVYRSGDPGVLDIYGKDDMFCGQTYMDPTYGTLENECRKLIMQSIGKTWRTFEGKGVMDFPESEEELMMFLDLEGVR